MKRSYNKPPKSAMALYVQIYFERQGRIKNRKCTLTEAAKSWVSLSKTDKQYFFNVYEEYKTKINESFAANLQSAQLYMKKKQTIPKRINESKTATIDHNQLACEDIGIHKAPTYHNMYEHDETEIQSDNEQLTTYESNIPLESVVYVSTQKDVSTLISEPTPPMSSSMDLFEIIKRKEVTTQDLNWPDLTKLQKQRYQRALKSIKNDYIKQYTAYLEQLTPEQLFHHYESKVIAE